MSEGGAAAAAAATTTTTTTTTASASAGEISTKPTVIKIDAKDCPVELVTVFTDRAEVVRNVKLDVSAPGYYDITVEGLTKCAIEDSVHVSGGIGAATILEVLCKRQKKLLEECGPSGNADKDAKKARLEDLLTQRKNLTIQRNVTSQTIAWLDNWADKVRRTPVNQARNDPAFLTAPYIENVRNFGKFFAEETLNHSTRLAQLNKNLEDLNKEINEIEAALKRMDSMNRRFELFTTAIVSMAVQQAGTVQFQLKYIVLNASWSSAYDCRVSSEGTMSITYYGEINNRTNEDWAHTHVLLSTASPSVGGHPGELKQATVSQHVEIQPLHFRASMVKKSRRVMARNEVLDEDGDELCDAEEEGERERPMKVLTATASKSLASCTFTINRKSSIASDGEKHRVTVTVIPDLQTKLCYICTPSETDRVFLKVSTVNKTEFPLLEGPCNTFIDGSFVATSTLKYTAIGEPFKFFLGTDKELKLKYVKPFRVDDKAGIIVKSSLQKFDGSIELRNCKSIPVNVCVKHALPKADDAEIKVNLIDPKIAKDDKAVKVNADSIIRWKSKVQPGETLKMHIQYTVSYPQGREVRFYN